MSEGPPVWKTQPPLDPGPAYHVWREDDQAWQEWTYPDDRHVEPPATVYFCSICHTPIEDEEPHTTEDGEDCHAECCPICKAENDAIAAAARAALPALAEIVRLWPFPGTDMQTVRELVQLLRAQEGATDEL